MPLRICVFLFYKPEQPFPVVLTKTSLAKEFHKSCVALLVGVQARLN